MGKEINPIKSNPTRKRQKFDKAFKLNAVALLKAGQKPATQLALELGIRRNLSYKWAETLANHGGDSQTAFNGQGHNKLGKQHDPIRAENKRLKRELARVTEELDILKKFDAYLTKAPK
jgi:transposase